MSGFYVTWPVVASGGGGSSGVNSIGSLDAQAASVNGASVAGSVLYMQSASSASGGAGVGLINTVGQAFLGNKVFVNQILQSDGTASAPGLGFFNQPGVGWYRIGSADVGFALGGSLQLEMRLVGSQTNFGFGGAASGTVTNPCNYYANYNGTALFQYTNQNTGSASAVQFQILAGANGNNYTSIENWANLNAGPYLAGGSALFAGPFQSQLNIGAEDTAASTYIAFNVNGRTLATEKMRLNPGNLTLNGGMQFVMTGSSSGAPTLTQQAATAGTGYTVTWPGSAGIAGQAHLYGAAGATIWGGLNSMVGSVSLTAQVSGVLPLGNTSVIPINGNAAQVSGSVSLTNQVVGNLPVSQTSGSISLTNQISGVLPQGNLTLAPSFTQATIGSVTQTSSSGGSAYTLSFPGTQASSSASTFINLGNGTTAWYPTGGMTVKTFSSSGSYIPSPGVVAIKVTTVGGGGGGGGAALTTGSNTAAAGGGAGGGTSVKWISTASLSSSYIYNVGQGGAGGVAGANNGTSGTSSIFYSVGSSLGVYAGGGTGGAGASATNNAAFNIGGFSNAGSGDLTFRGFPGGYGFSFNASFSLTQTGGASGAGGGSYLSGGTAPQAGVNAINLSGNANQNYGGGGSGALNTGSGGSAVAGGLGTAGIILIEEYYY